MRRQSLISLSLLLAGSAVAVPWNDGKKPAPPAHPEPPAKPGKHGHGQKPYVNTEALMGLVYLSDLEEGAYVLQGISDRYNNTRAIGTPGHEATLKFIENTLIRTGGYEIEKQYLDTYRYTSLGNTPVEINGAVPNISTPDFSPAGSANGQIIYSALGCETSDFPSTVSGQIALVDRGVCEFGLKVALAGAAGASGIIIANNEEANPDAPADAVTLGEPTRPQGPFVPAISISLNYGLSIREGATGSFTVNAETALITTHNIIAETKTGDHNNVITVGAHTDSVTAGPGVNDDGSGTISILRVAEKLSQYSVKNAVRFCFWTAEEVGLVGSTHYVESLSQKEVEKIRMNLNFDMLASPNYIYMIFDGDGDAFGLTGPTGSSQIETLFQEYFDARNTAWNATAFDGRSDYGPFLDVNIPAGGLFTGAEEVKTEADAARFGGTVGEAYDRCYHQACDDINNLAFDAWLFNTKAVAYAIATYSDSLAGFPANNATAVAPERRRSFARRAAHTHAGTSPHGHGGCGPKVTL